MPVVLFWREVPVADLNEPNAPTYLIFDDMTWPHPDDPRAVEWRLRYGHGELSRADRMVAASYIDAYRQLVRLSRDARNARVTGIRRAEEEAGGSGRYDIGRLMDNSRDADESAAEAMLAHYMAALDEIYRLRCALVIEARGVEADLLLATFPKSRRRYAEERVERMRAAVRGEADQAYKDRLDPGSGGLRTGVQELLIAAGASPTLTRHEWEERNR